MKNGYTVFCLRRQGSGIRWEYIKQTEDTVMKPRHKNTKIHTVKFQLDSCLLSQLKSPVQHQQSNIQKRGVLLFTVVAHFYYVEVRNEGLWAAENWIGLSSFSNQCCQAGWLRLFIHALEEAYSIRVLWSSSSGLQTFATPYNWTVMNRSPNVGNLTGQSPLIIITTNYLFIPAVFLNWTAL